MLLSLVCACFAGGCGAPFGDASLSNSLSNKEKQTAEFLDVQMTDLPVPEQESGEERESEPAQDAAPENTEKKVYVCGAVKNPGVYSFKEGDRIADLVSAAGGFTEEACPEGVNLAAYPEDGQMLRIPTPKEAAEGLVSLPTGEAKSDGRININTADAAALQTLPGVGESRALAIIAYREEKGPFSAPEEIMNVSGIKEGLYTKIKDHIKVGG